MWKPRCKKTEYDISSSVNVSALRGGLADVENHNVNHCILHRHHRGPRVHISLAGRVSAVQYMEYEAATN